MATEHAESQGEGGVPLVHRVSLNKSRKQREFPILPVRVFAGKQSLKLQLRSKEEEVSVSTNA